MLLHMLLHTLIFIKKNYYIVKPAFQLFNFFLNIILNTFLEEICIQNSFLFFFCSKVIRINPLEKKSFENRFK